MAHDAAPTGPPPFPLGGQAVIEGVLIRSARAIAIAVRAPDGRIVVRSEPVAPPAAALRRLPVLRGIAALYETLSHGVRALYWSSAVAAGREEQRLARSEVAVSAAALATAAAAFIGGPALLASWLNRGRTSRAADMVTEGLVRIAMLVGYVSFVGRLPEVRRVFGYHGAEHRAIHAHEHSVELTPENVRRFANEHPRCGTAYLLTVGLLSLATFSALGRQPFRERVTSRLLLTPVIGGVAYEWLRASQAHGSHPLVRLAGLPNLWLQKLTTRDPDDAQIEVAITAVRSALAQERRAVARAPVATAPLEAGHAS